MYSTRWVPQKETFEEFPPLQKKLILSKVEAPSLELKPLPKDLKDGFLGPDKIFPVISVHLEEN